MTAEFPLVKNCWGFQLRNESGSSCYIDSAVCSISGASMILESAKICRPETGTSLPRERLFKLLDGCLSRSAVWVHGPAGSGKTTMVSGYSASRNLIPLWYQCDSGDADIASFFHVLGVAAKSLMPRRTVRLLQLTPEYFQDIESFTIRFLDAFYHLLPPRSCVVFDNYQDLPEDSHLHQIISTLLERAPHHIQIILISRKEPPPQYIRQRANAKLSLVGWQFLRLELDEVRKIVALRSSEEVSPEVICHMHETTGGWAAGLTLLMEQHSLTGTFHRRISASQEIFNYFASQVLAKISPEVDVLLMATSFLTCFTIEIARELTGFSSAAALINSLISGNFFITRHLTDHDWYQYHHLFHEYLQKRAQERMPHGEWYDMCERAARVAANNGLIDDQVRLYCYVENWKSLVDVLNFHAPSLIGQGRGCTVTGWLTSVPRQVIETTPWFLFWESVCMAPTNPVSSRAGFETAARLFEQQGEFVGSQLALASSIDLCFYTFEFKPLDSLIPRVLSHLAIPVSYPTPEVEYRVTMSIFNALSIRTPDHLAIDQWRAAASRQVVSLSNIDSNMRVRNLVNMVTDCVWGGNLPQAASMVALMDDVILKGEVNELHRIMAINIKAIYAMFTDVEAIPVIVEAGCALAKESGIGFLDNHLMSTAVVAALSTSNYSLADIWLGRMAGALASPMRFDGAIFHQLTAWQYLTNDSPAKALIHQMEALRIIRDIGWTIIEPCFLVGLTLIFHANGNSEQAATQLEEALALSRRNGSKLNELMCLLAAAEISFAQGDRTEGNGTLLNAMRLWRSVGAINLIWFRSAVMADLCVSALEAGIETDFVCSLIRSRNLMPAKPPLMVVGWPWPLRITTLGKFQIERESAVLEFSGKVQKKPLELLKALISFGGRAVDEHVLCDVLWAEGEGDKAHMAFATTLFRLRQLLGNEQALIVRNGQLSLNHHLVWVDVWAFEHIVQSTHVAWNDPHRIEDALKLTEQAIAHYNGEFLPADRDKPWSFALRERLKSKFIFRIETLGTYLEQSGDAKKAIRYYHSALEIEPLAEEFYQRLMLCYHRYGQRAEAVAVYNQCRYLLKHSLSIAPSPATEAIYQTIALN